MGDAATPTLPNFTNQTASVYKANIDAGFAVLDRLAWAFAPHEQDVGSPQPDMTLRLEAGAIFDGTLTEVAAQDTAIIAAPSVDPRIDRVVIDRQSGAVSVVTGTEAASPIPPALPAGKVPVAQVALAVSQTEIVNADITDERELGILGLAELAFTAITALSALTSPATGDEVAVHDASAGAERKITLADLWTVVDTFSEIASVDGAQDILAIFDASVGAIRKVKPDDLVAGGLVLLTTASASNSSSIDFTSGIDSTYEAYIVIGTEIVPVSDNVRLNLRTDSTGGASFDAGASDYKAHIDGGNSFDGAVITTRSGTDKIEATSTGGTNAGIGSAAGEKCNFVLWMFNPAGTGYTDFAWTASWDTAGTQVASAVGSARRDATHAVNAIRFLLSSGNISSGEFRLYGVKKS